MLSKICYVKMLTKRKIYQNLVDTTKNMCDHTVNLCVCVCLERAAAKSIVNN